MGRSRALAPPCGRVHRQALSQLDCGSLLGMRLPPSCSALALCLYLYRTACDPRVNSTGKSRAPGARHMVQCREQSRRPLRAEFRRTAQGSGRPPPVLRRVEQSRGSRGAPQSACADRRQRAPRPLARRRRKLSSAHCERPVSRPIAPRVFQLLRASFALEEWDNWDFEFEDPDLPPKRVSATE